ncbi:glycosyl transferase [Pedobacter quisquiliarum]|uniref:Glycosyl transferase n=1 Tax=Pedobacter quisquiliarum TaxID=1834438 RepID=A0A916UBH7_9SPHI|nr:glycosyltransferase family 2 protein [Pedobacter quisquiliarum]GGC64950.1 glycosyl transferase [Pedobacter quisquiliarum]
MDDLVVIIILNWNGADVTNECIDSLLKLSYRNYKIIIVDNGSVDNSLNSIALKSPNIDVLPLIHNQGFTGGNIAGLRYASNKYNSKFVLMLNNDTIVEPDFLTMMMATIVNVPECYAVVPKIYYYDDPSLIWFAGGRVSRISGVVTHYGLNRRDSPKYSIPCETKFMNGCCALISIDAINQLGFLDNQFFANSEDADYSLRILDSNHKIYYEPKAIIFHKVSHSFKSNKGKWLAFYLAARGIVLLQRKHLSGLSLILFYFVFSLRWVAYLTLKLLLVLDFKSIKAIYNGAYDGLKGRLRFVGQS